MSTLLELDSIRCTYNDTVAVNNVSLCIREGNIVCLLGPSGSGKSTILRAVAGLEQLTSGQIILNDEIISSETKFKAPEKRQMGMVFQDYALFPHLNVRDNICFGLRKLTKAALKNKSEELLDVVGMNNFGHRFPHELSGGQQQRIALARALAIQPKLILMDEPFSNLDVELRERLSHDVRNILKDQNMTCIMVTHDQAEAFVISDKVAVINEGKLQQWDTSYNLYHDPINRFVAEFIGQGVFLPGVLQTPESVQTEVGLICGDRAYDWPKGSKVEVLIRPDDVKISNDSDLLASVVNKSFKGSEILYTLKLPTGYKLLSALPSHSNHNIGESISIKLDLHHLIAFQ